MRKDIHPNYRLVVFLDTSCNHSFIIKSTVETSETIKMEDGIDYPLYKIETSSISHPAYTGKRSDFSKLGKVEKFNQKYSRNNNKNK